VWWDIAKNVFDVIFGHLLIYATCLKICGRWQIYVAYPDKFSPISLYAHYLCIFVAHVSSDFYSLFDNHGYPSSSVCGSSFFIN
jgi:hypothetical protein